MVKNQDDFVYVGRPNVGVTAGGGVTENPLETVTSIVPTTVTVQPGVVFRVSNLTLSIEGTAGGGVASGGIATAQVTDANGTVYAELIGSGIGTYKLDAEIGDPIGNQIGPFTAATVLRCSLVRKTASMASTCHATLERMVPSPSNTTVV